MADIEVTIGTQDEQLPGGPPVEAEEKPDAQITLDMRKTLDGSIAIYDHPEIDIVVMPHMLKVITFAKDEMGDHIYGAQSRLFNYLAKKGVIVYDSVQGGNLYGSLEANLPPQFEEGVDPVQVVLFVLDKFIKEEAPHYSKVQDYEKDLNDWWLEPDDDTSTDLDWATKTHKARKGVQNKWTGGVARYSIYNNTYRG